MQDAIEQQQADFHNRARSVFFHVYGTFGQAIASLDRQGDENVFQQLRNRYASQLHLQLHSIALELLDQVEAGNRHSLNYSLSQSIEEYVKEFVQKVKSL